MNYNEIIKELEAIPLLAKSFGKKKCNDLFNKRGKYLLRLLLSQYNVLAYYELMMFGGYAEWKLEVVNPIKTVQYREINNILFVAVPNGCLKIFPDGTKHFISNDYYN